LGIKVTGLNLIEDESFNIFKPVFKELSWHFQNVQEKGRKRKKKGKGEGKKERKSKRVK
jgi:hypothetical protein